MNTLKESMTSSVDSFSEKTSSTISHIKEKGKKFKFLEGGHKKSKKRKKTRKNKNRKKHSTRRRRRR